MAQKRKAQDAFGASKGQLSAFAAAKLARSKPVPAQLEKSLEQQNGTADLAAPTGFTDDTEPYIDPARARLLLEDEDVVQTPPLKAVPTPLSTFRPNRANVSQDDVDYFEATLQSDETATLIGEYDITVISGLVTVYGAVLRAGSGARRIYAPSTQALPQIQARQNDTTVRLSSTRSGLRKLEKLSPLFRNIWTTPLADRSFAFLGSTTDDALQRSLNTLEIDRDTDAVLRTLSAKTSVEPRRPRIMAIGAKSSGKSTFNRLLCNQLLSWTSIDRCLYLDVDPGQPDFGPPGIISLVEVSAPILGPPFSHPSSPSSPQYKLIRSHAIAATSFKDDPEHYKACVLDLARHIHGQYPLVVNSCGWVSGLGASILVDLTQDLEISDIVLMEPVESSLIASLQRSSPSIALHKIALRPPRPSSRTPAEQRAMQTMAYFHSRPTMTDRLLRWSGKSINRRRPWLVSYAGSNNGILAVMSYGQSPALDFLVEVLDGATVAINVVDEEASSDLADDIVHTPEGLPFIAANDQGISKGLLPSRSRCVGLALVRGTNTEAKQIQLVTPVPESQIAALDDQKVILVRGGFDPPEWAYLEDLYKDDVSRAQAERPWVSRRGPVGVEGAVWRLRHPPMAKDVMLGR